MGKFGPHAGKEVGMMIAGTKPAALLTKKQMAILEPYVPSLSLIVKTSPMGYVVGQPGNESGVDQIISFLTWMDESTERESCYVMSQKPNTLYHATLGRLLGYSEDDINFCLNKMELRRQDEQDKKAARLQRYLEI
jgi:hypothetical protein